MRRRQVLEVGVVRHDDRDVDRQRADPLPEQQVVEAVPEAGDEDDGAGALVGVHQAPPHPERLGDADEPRRQALQRRHRVERAEVHAHEERALVVADVVVVLVAVEDVAAVLDEEARHRVDDPRPVGAASVRTNSRRGAAVTGWVGTGAGSGACTPEA